MIRNLMLILGLSLTVAAFGCSSEDGNGGSGGSGGSGAAGGSGGSGGAPSGACTGSADLTVICDAGFTAAATACGTENLGAGAEAIGACIAEDTGLSQACSICFGETTQCTIDNCLAAGCAADPMGEDCTNCRAENCDPAFESCAGEFSCEGAGGSGGMGGAGGSGGTMM